MSTTEVPLSLPGNVSLADHDPEMFDLIEKEKVCVMCTIFMLNRENSENATAGKCGRPQPAWVAGRL